MCKTLRFDQRKWQEGTRQEIVILGEMAQLEQDKRWCNADAFKLGLREGASSVQGEKEELAEERANKSSSHQSNKSLNTSTT